MLESSLCLHVLWLKAKMTLWASGLRPSGKPYHEVGPVNEGGSTVIDTWKANCRATAAPEKAASGSKAEDRGQT